MSNANLSTQHSGFRQLLMNHLRALVNSLGQLSRAPFGTLLTFAVIGIALALPLSLSVALKNIQVVSSGFKHISQINLYLKPNLSATDVHNTMLVLNMDESIAGSQYISPAKGLKEFSQNAGFSQFANDFSKNPLPGVIVVTPSKNLSIAKTRQLLARLSHLPSVTNAQLDMRWLKRLDAILAIGHRLAALLMVIFAIAVLLIIANTIKLTTQNHHDEILVIKLIGGTHSFIRRPFLYSGLLYGLIGAIVAWFIVDIIISFLAGPITKLASLYGTTYTIQGLGLTATLWLLLAGIVLGLLASWLAVTRYIASIEPR